MVGNMNSDFHVAIVGMHICTVSRPIFYPISLTHHPGAGIGGLALAMALHKKSVPFTLYEDANEFSAVGYVLTTTLPTKASFAYLTKVLVSALRQTGCEPWI